MDYYFFDPAESYLLADAIVRLAESGNLEVDEHNEIYQGLNAAWHGASEHARRTGEPADFAVARSLSSLELLSSEYYAACCKAQECYRLFEYYFPER